MMAEEQKLRLKHLLVETIQVLCKNSLPGEASFCIEATIGITLNSDNVMVISFKEQIQADGSHVSLMLADEHGRHQQQCKTVKDDAKHMLCLCSSRGANENEVQHSDSETRSGRDHVKSQQYHGNGESSLTNDIDVVESNTVSNHTVPENMKSLCGREACAADHCSMPLSDSRFAFTQSVASSETEARNIVIKIEEADETIVSANSEQHFCTAVTAPAMKSGCSAEKWKHAHVSPCKKSHENTVCDSERQPSVFSTGNNRIQHVGSSCQQLTVFEESFDAAAIQLNESSFATYGGQHWPQSKTVWSCNLCGAWLGSKRTLRNHVRKKHMGLKTERCRLCGETFRWAGQVVRHKQLCHSEPL